MKYEEFHVGIGVGAAFRTSSMKMPAGCFRNRQVFAEVAVDMLGEAQGLAHSGRGFHVKVLKKSSLSP